MSSSSLVIPRLPPPAGEKKKPRRFNLSVLGAGLVGGLFGFFSVRYGVDLLVALPGAKLLKVVALLTLPVVWLGAVGFHELGHLVGGWLMGGRFILWVAGPIMVRRTPAGVKVGWNRSVNVAGGMAICLPREPALMTPRRTAVMILGGPFFSLLLGGIALGLGVWLLGGAGALTPARAWLQTIMMFTAGISLLLFLATAIPGLAGGFKTDGKRVYDLLRGGPASDQEAALLVLTASGLAGVRPAAYDPALVGRALALNDGSLFDLYARMNIYYHAADRGDWLAAQAHLDAVLAGADRVVPYVRDVVRCEYAWLLATRTTDAAAARAWLETAGKLEFEPATRLRAEAAVLLAEGKFADAAAKARDALYALEHKSLSPVKSIFAAEAIEAILQRAAVPQM